MAQGRSKCRRSSGLHDPHGEDVGETASAKQSEHGEEYNQLAGGVNGSGALKKPGAAG